MNIKVVLIALLLPISSMGQTDYYNPQNEEVVQPSKEQGRTNKKRERLKRKMEKQTRDAHGKCYCPYQTSTSVWDDIWNTGVVGTAKAVYQSTIKPQAIGEVVGAVQGAAADAPIPALAGQTAVALAISETNKARRHQRNRRPPQAGMQCNCDPCPYHGQRYKPNQGIQ